MTCSARVVLSRVDESASKNGRRVHGEPKFGSRPIYNGPQPRSWGKPGRDAKSVVPGLRPGDRRARRRWPAAAGMFWRRELVTCETVTGVVIDVATVFCALEAHREVDPQRRLMFATRRARWVGRRNVDGYHPSALDPTIPKTGGPALGDGRVGFGVARGFAVVR